MKLQPILVVEDDAVLRRVVARNLEARGYLVQEAGTFRERCQAQHFRAGFRREQLSVKKPARWTFTKQNAN